MSDLKKLADIVIDLHKSLLAEVLSNRLLIATLLQKHLTSEEYKQCFEDFTEYQDDLRKQMNEASEEPKKTVEDALKEIAKEFQEAREELEKNDTSN